VVKHLLLLGQLVLKEAVADVLHVALLMRHVLLLAVEVSRLLHRKHGSCRTLSVSEAERQRAIGLVFGGRMHLIGTELVHVGVTGVRLFHE
jgi:hypothetical protein